MRFERHISRFLGATYSMLECRPGKCDVGCSCKPFEVPPILYGAVYSKDGTNANTENSRGRMEPYSDRQDQSENEDWESSRLKFCEFIGQLSAFLILCLRSTSMVILVKHTRIPDKPLQRQVNVFYIANCILHIYCILRIHDILYITYPLHVTL